VVHSSVRLGVSISMASGVAGEVGLGDCGWVYVDTIVDICIIDNYIRDYTVT